MIQDGPLTRLVRMVASWTGIDLDRGGRNDSLERFLHTRVKALGLPSIEAYVASLTGPAHPEVVRLINSVTVGHTWFYRDPDQLAVIARLLQTGFPIGRRIGIWIAGCASGEDVYTIAMLADRAARPAQIVGTDINSDALAVAKQGRYGDWSVRDVPPDLRPFYLPQAPDGRFEVSPSLRHTTSFVHHNLRDPVPVSPVAGGWDLILCRNVLIYFSTETSLSTVDQLSRSLTPDGWLLLGASELIHSLPPQVEAVRFGERYALRRSSSKLRPAPAPLPAPVPVAVPAPEISGPAPTAVDSAWQHIETGNVKLDAGNLSGALAEYAKALELDPLSTEARLYTGIAYHMEDDHAAAVHELRAALFLDPDLWPASYYLALSYEKLGRKGEAQREYRRVLERSNLAPALKTRGGLLRNLEAWRHDVMMMARKRTETDSGGRRMERS
jgi:chemotaxis protein methyltransferase CheR